MSFLLMAAHDTLTSSLSSLIYHIAINPEWQEKLREEALSLNLDENFPYEKLDEMPLAEMAFKEAMRLYPPVPIIPRLAVREFEFGGYTIPANTVVAISPMATQTSSELWVDPDEFDPLRFSQENSRNRHKYAWVPFSGGAHMCLGLHFAYMQMKCFVARLLLTSKIVVPEGYKTDWQILPIPRPKDGLPIRIEII
jgi:cytochrome P450